MDVLEASLKSIFFDDSKYFAILSMPSKYFFGYKIYEDNIPFLAIPIWDVNIDKLVLSEEFPCAKKGSKYFVGYKSN